MRSVCGHYLTAGAFHLTGLIAQREHLLALGSSEKRDTRDVRLWIENDELQDRQIVTQQAPDRLRLKQLRTVLNTGDTAEIRIHDEQTQVELRRMPGYVHRSHLQRPQSGARH